MIPISQSASQQKQIVEASGSRLRKKPGVLSFCELVLMAFSALMILSDCSTLLGSWASNLKYIGLILLASYILFKAFSWAIPAKKLLFCMLGLFILLSCIPLQTGDFSWLQAIGLYLLVFLFACYSECIGLDGRKLYRTGLFSLALVAGLLLLSYEDCVTQYAYYASVGRPRLLGCFSNPNSLGGISATIIMMLVIGHRCREARSAGRVMFILCLGIGVAVLILSGSRTSMLMIAAFCVFLVYSDHRHRLKRRSGKFALFAVLLLFLAASVVFIASGVEGDTAVSLRLDTLQKIEINGLASIVGYGFASSGSVRDITNLAGGAVDILWVSAYYKVGIAGIAAFLLLILGALQNGRKSSISESSLGVALLAALFLQSIGESYLFSVMSFVSAMNWLLLSNIQLLSDTENARESNS